MSDLSPSAVPAPRAARRRRTPTVRLINGEVWQDRQSFARHIARLSKEAALKLATQTITSDDRDYINFQKCLREFGRIGPPSSASY